MTRCASETARRNERAAVLWHVRGKLRALAAMRLKLRLSAETAADRRHVLTALRDEIRGGLHRQEGDAR